MIINGIFIRIDHENRYVSVIFFIHTKKKQQFGQDKTRTKIIPTCMTYDL